MNRKFQIIPSLKVIYFSSVEGYPYGNLPNKTFRIHMCSDEIISEKHVLSSVNGINLYSHE